MPSCHDDRFDTAWLRCEQCGPQQSPPRPERYRRSVSYGLGHKGLKSKLFERRGKRSFRRWMRRRA